MKLFDQGVIEALLVMAYSAIYKLEGRESVNGQTVLGAGYDQVKIFFAQHAHQVADMEVPEPERGAATTISEFAAQICEQRAEAVREFQHAPTLQMPQK
jgi:hypothetical protein